MALRLLIVLAAAHAFVAPHRTLSTPRRQGTRRATTTMAAKIPWRTVFICEYTAPLLVFPAVSKAGPFATLASTLWTLHFAKRLAETLCVHKFSKGAMPLSNLFKNCAYYGGAAVVVAYDVSRRPAYGAQLAQLFTQLSRTQRAFVGAWVLCELLNLYTHLHLASLRSDGSREAKIPTAWPWSRLQVCSPNYSFEIGSWVFYSLVTRSPAAWAFTAVGAAQMAVWSRQKLKRYKRKFKGEAAFTATHALVPGVF